MSLWHLSALTLQCHFHSVKSEVPSKAYEVLDGLAPVTSMTSSFYHFPSISIHAAILVSWLLLKHTRYRPQGLCISYSVYEALLRFCHGSFPHPVHIFA